MSINNEFVETNKFHIEQVYINSSRKNMHYHFSMEIYLLLEGEREYFIEDQFYNIQPGDLVLIPQNMLHRTGGKGAKRFLIYVTNSFLSPYFSQEMLSQINSFTSPLVVRPNSNDKKKLNDSMNKILSLYNEHNLTSESSLKIAYELFFILHYFATEGKQYIIHPISNLKFSNIITYINKNYQHIYTLSDVTKEFYMNESYFSRTFSKIVGVHFFAYLNILKIRHAIELLNSNKNIRLEDLAEQCGFNSTTYFCRIFKNQVGVSPKKYNK